MSLLNIYILIHVRISTRLFDHELSQAFKIAKIGFQEKIIFSEYKFFRKPLSLNLVRIILGKISVVQHLSIQNVEKKNWYFIALNERRF